MHSTTEVGWARQRPPVRAQNMPRHATERASGFRRGAHARAASIAAPRRGGAACLCQHGRWHSYYSTCGHGEKGSCHPAPSWSAGEAAVAKDESAALSCSLIWNWDAGESVRILIGCLWPERASEPHEEQRGTRKLCTKKIKQRCLAWKSVNPACSRGMHIHPHTFTYIHIYPHTSTYIRIAACCSEGERGGGERESAALQKRPWRRHSTSTPCFI